MKVRVVCTTDDPADSLEHHEKLQADTSFPVTVVPAFRPDAALAVENPASFNAWMFLILLFFCRESIRESELSS
jgi:glucuronate isomerase